MWYLRGFGRGKGGNEDTGSSTEAILLGHMGLHDGFRGGRVEMKLQSVQQRVGRAPRHTRSCRDKTVDVYIQHDGRSMLEYVYITA